MDSGVEGSLDLVQDAYRMTVEVLVGYSFQIFGALVVLVVGYLLGGWAGRALLRFQERRDVDLTLRVFLAGAARATIIALAVIVALSGLGISITPLIAAIGGLAVGLSLAIQGPVSNYGAGLAIILTRMYRVGDTITVRGCSGLVEEVSLAATRLRAEDGEAIVIPNKQIVGEIHRNSAEHRIVEGEVGIAHGADPHLAIAQIRRILDSAPDADPRLPAQVGIAHIGDSAIRIGYRFWIPTRSYFERMYAINLQIWDALQSAGIAIGVPQREVRIAER
jgi:small conductance mechanosensitive channel